MKIKSFVTFSLIIFVAVIILILGGAVFLKQNSSNINQNSPAVSNSQNNQTAAATSFTLAEVSKHNTESDCWTIVSDKVYNVTDIIPGHPGGSQAIIPFCGKDATTAFETKGGRGAHSQRANDVLNTYYVGNIAK